MDASRPWCLIVEDEALLGLALEDGLEEAGIVVAGPLASCAEVLAWIELRDGSCIEFARALLRRGARCPLPSVYPKPRIER